MLRGLGRALWWIVTYERPVWAGDYAALLALVGLAALGALAIAWPWLSDEMPRALAAGWAVVHATIVDWVGRLWAARPRFE